MESKIGYMKFKFEDEVVLEDSYKEFDKDEKCCKEVSMISKTNEEEIEWSKEYRLIHLDMSHNDSNY